MSDGLHELGSLPLNSYGIARIRHWLRTVLGLDRAVGFTVLARFWGSAAGLITVLLIARFLSLGEQGYYYTFGSLVAMQMIFELGFSYVILQLASHERARLSISTDYEISGDPVAHARLASVIQKSVRWYSVAAVLLGAYSLGLAVPFLLTAAAIGAVLPALNRVKRFLPAIEFAAGAFLIVVGLVLVNNAVLNVAGWFYQFVPQPKL